MYISEITDQAPADARGELETKVYETLHKLNIPFQRVDNDPVEAMEECGEIGERLGAEIRKTIVLCNRKKTLFYLCVLPAGKHFDTKTFCERTGAPRVSFASGESMQAKLGVSPGSATIMGVLNDPDRAVQVVIDKEVAEAEWFACNPGTNTAHIRVENGTAPFRISSPCVAQGHDCPAVGGERGELWKRNGIRQAVCSGLSARPCTTGTGSGPLYF